MLKASQDIKDAHSQKKRSEATETTTTKGHAQTIKKVLETTTTKGHT
jgi:hypothetical protein